MKKRVSIFLTAALTVSLLAGCSQSSGGSSDIGSAGGSSGGSDSVPSAAEEYTMKDATAADNEYYTITANKAETTEDMDCAVELTITNKTGADLIFDLSDIYMNGYSAHSSWNEDSEHFAYADPDSIRGQMMEEAGDDRPLGIGVPAGSATTETCTFTLNDYNMPVIDEILFRVVVYFQNVEDDPSEAGYDAENGKLTPEQAAALTERVEYGIYPTGLTADTVEYPEHQKAEGEQVIVDDENFTFIIQGVEKEEDGTFRIRAYVENKMDVPLSYEWTESEVNGVPAELFQYTTSLDAKKRDYTVESLFEKYDDCYPESGEIETIAFHLLAQKEAELYTYETVYEGSFTCSFE